MAEFQFGRERHYLSLLFLVGMFLHSMKTPAHCSEDNTRRCIGKEREALLHIHPACTNANHTYWNLHDCCDWPGVYCSNFTGRIYRLRLVDFLDVFCQLGYATQTSLNSSLLALEDLQDLDFTGDEFEDVYFFNGQIPGFIGSFHNLRYLNLSSTQFNGAIPPQLGNLTRLQSLEISSYDYGDVLHARNLAWLTRLTSLKHLVLQNIDLSGARDWIHVVNNLPSLTYLDLLNTRLPDVIPSRLSNYNSSKSLAYVDLSNNNLQASSVWTWLFNHSSLVEVYLSRNQLKGSMPNKFSSMTSLSHLDLSSNQLDGAFPVPIHIHFYCSLETLDLSRNKLAGDLPSIFQYLLCAKDSLTSLALQHNQLRGSVPDITVFSSLRKLALHNNRLDGSLPFRFKTTSGILILNLHNNHLAGSVPDLSVFRLLKVLQLQNNHLNGTIHLGLGQLSSLVKLDFSSNSLKGQIFAGHLSNLSSLRYLDMSFNLLTLNISSVWVPPFRLTTIGLASCKLGPHFPVWLRTQTYYSKLDMSHNMISDSIPFWFWNVSSVATYIALSHNQLRGVLPDSSILFSMDPAVDLSFNLLEGTIPSFLANVQYLNVSRNSFSGSISFLCQRTSYGGLFGLDLSHNFFSGKLPDCWMIQDLLVLDLSNNNFTGNLPTALGSLSNLESLHLRNNKFSGNLALSLGNLSSLLYLDLGDNLFSGEIPPQLFHSSCLGRSACSSLTKLTVLSLRNNSFSGSIPLQLCRLSSLQIFDLSMNKVSGIIPNCLCNLTAMTQKNSTPSVIFDTNGTFSTHDAPYKDYISLVLKGFTYEYKNHLELVKSIDLSSNKLGGKIPPEISCLTGLVSLNLSGNNLVGSITSKIGELKVLESLDLSKNHLSGEIPPTLSSLNFLATLNLANNNLSGGIPMGTQVQSFNAAVFGGNPRLCGDPLLKKCPGDVDSKGDDGGEADTNHSAKDESLGLYISIVLGFITGFWGACGVLIFKRSWRYAYFRFWSRLYDSLYLIIALMVALIRRRSHV